MPSKKKSENPFRGFTIAEVVAAEVSTYTIQVGSDFYCHDGRFAFTKRQAKIHFNKILVALLDIVQSGDEEQIKDAKRCLNNMFIHPLRIQ